MRSATVWSTVLLFVLGCNGGNSGGGSTGGGSGTGAPSTGSSSSTGAGGGGTGAGGGGTGAGGAGDCSGYVGLASPAELAVTPRPDGEAEQLALEATGAFIAPSDVYDRISKDLGSIRAAHPEVASLHALQTWQYAMHIGFDSLGQAAVMGGTYTDWDCPNALYGAEVNDIQDLFSILTFNRHVDVPLLVPIYAALPHVTMAEAPGVPVDGDDVCVSIGGATYSYVFDAGSGDCAAGCIHHTYHGFSTQADGSVTVLGTFDTDQPPAPAWFTGLPDCTKWL